MREPSSTKTPRTAIDVKPEKKPRANTAEADSFYHLKPTWRLSNLRLPKPFGWGDIDRDDMVQVIQRLQNLESMTWGAILIDGKKQNHHCNTSDICKDAQTCLDEDWQGGADEVVTLRVTGVKRVWGIIERGVCFLLWWDPEHQVFPSTYMDRRS